MANFTGFTSNESFTPIPDTLFHMLGEIKDLNELKLTLYVIWRIEHMEGAFRQICVSEIIEDEQFMRSSSQEDVESGLTMAVERGILLEVPHPDGVFYFLNSPRGRASAEAMRQGNWRASGRPSLPPREIPNIFKLYEENIGPLTPLIADTLKDAETEYTADWVADAIEHALKQNVRNWKYIDAILRRWKEEGRGEKQNRRNAEASHGDDAVRKFEEFFGRKP